ncbi:hypothetical protein [Streptomyces sp. NPDC005953]|uniref:hypothetical protein n=1 Tax=unclassified Streptomyces TaxID=2593676 RepID=UPI0033F73920
MTLDALTAPAPTVFCADCVECGRATAAAVPVRWTHAGEILLYACPHCAPLLTPGPAPDEYAPSR